MKQEERFNKQQLNWTYEMSSFTITFAGDMNKKWQKRGNKKFICIKMPAEKKTKTKIAKTIFVIIHSGCCPKIQNAFAAILRSYNDRIAQHIQATIFVFYLHTYIFGER